MNTFDNIEYYFVSDKVPEKIWNQLGELKAASFRTIKRNVIVAFDNDGTVQCAWEGHSNVLWLRIEEAMQATFDGWASPTGTEVLCDIGKPIARTTNGMSVVRPLMAA